MIQRRLLPSLFFVFFCTYTLCQKGPNFRSFQREIRFIDLTEGKNDPYFRIGTELPALWLDGIRTGELKAHKVTLHDGTWAETYDTATIKDQLVAAFVDDFGDQVEYLFDQDFSVIGLQMLIDRDYRPLLEYVHFYVPPSLAGTLEYRFSIKASEALDYLISRKALALEMTKRAWWKGNIFLTHQNYAMDCGALIPMIELTAEDTSFRAWDPADGQHYDLTFVDAEVKEAGLTYDLYLNETREPEGYRIKEVGATRHLWGNESEEDRFEVNFAEYTSRTLEKSRIPTRSVYPMASGIIREFYQESLDYERQMIHDQKTPEKKEAKTWKKSWKAQQKKASLISKGTFRTDFTEGLYLERKGNAHFYQDDEWLSAYILDHVQKGNLRPFDAYKGDTTWLSAEVFEKRIQIVTPGDLFVEDIDPFDEKGYQPGDTVLFEGVTYIVEEGEDEFGFGDLYNYLYLQPLTGLKASFDEITAMDLCSDLTFNEQGLQKNYQLKSLQVSIPANHPDNVVGFQKAICWVLWDELGPRLKEERPEWYKALTERDFYSFFYYTTTVHPLH